MINPYPAEKISPAKFLVRYKFQGTSNSSKVSENIVRVSIILDPGETRRLIQIKAVCIWDYGRDRPDKGQPITLYAIIRSSCHFLYFNKNVLFYFIFNQ